MSSFLTSQCVAWPVGMIHQRGSKISLSAGGSRPLGGAGEDVCSARSSPAAAPMEQVPGPLPQEGAGPARGAPSPALPPPLVPAWPASPEHPGLIACIVPVSTPGPSHLPDSAPRAANLHPFRVLSALRPSQKGRVFACTFSRAEPHPRSQEGVVGWHSLGGWVPGLEVVG